MHRRAVLLVLIAFASPVRPDWVVQQSHTTARLRGICAVSERIAWASGTAGTYAKTVDGGETWKSATVPGAEKLDFRDVEAFSANTAYLLSIGPGESSRIYKTVDGGGTWDEVFRNKDPMAFFDAIAFWDEKHGLAVGDPVDGRFTVIRTSDGGQNWVQIPPQGMPPALQGEGAFAASGTCLIARGTTHAWFATGGAASARVFRSLDGGLTWAVSQTPLLAGTQSAGAFSLGFFDEKTGVVLGGDYRKEKEAVNNIALTRNGGVTWTKIKGSGLSGFRSAVAGLNRSGTRVWIAIGPQGADLSADAGENWSRFGNLGFHAFSFAPGSSIGWGAGEQGSIARLNVNLSDR